VQRTTTIAATIVPNVFFIFCVLRLLFIFFVFRLTLDNARSVPIAKNRWL